MASPLDSQYIGSTPWVQPPPSAVPVPVDPFMAAMQQAGGLDALGGGPLNQPAASVPAPPSDAMAAWRAEDAPAQQVAAVQAELERKARLAAIPTGGKPWWQQAAGAVERAVGASPVGGALGLQSPAVPQQAPAARPRSMVPPGAAAPQIPPELQQHGGGYFQPGYLDDVDAALAAGKINEAQAKQLRARYQTSSPGLVAQVEHGRNELAQEQSRLAAEGLEAEERGGRMQEDARSRALRADQEREQEAQLRRRIYDGERARQEASYERAAQEIRDTKPGPDVYWAKKGTGGKVQAAIAIGLGALGQGLLMTAGKGNAGNPALDMLNREIEQDIEAQRAALDNKRTALGAKETLLGRMRQHFNDNEEAEAAARKQLWSQVEQQVASIGGDARNQQLALKKQGLIAHAQQQQQEADLGMRLRAQVGADVEAQRRAAAAAWAAGGGAARAAADQQWKPIGAEDDARIVRLPDGGEYLAANADEAKKIRSGGAALQELDVILRDLEQVYSAQGTVGILSPGTKDRGEALAKQAQLKLKEVANTGTLDAGSVGYLESIIPTPGYVAAGNMGAEKVKLARATAQSGYQAQLRNSNLTPIERALGPDKKGRVVPQMRYATPQGAPAAPEGEGR